MADLTPEEAALKAYAASNASLKDYDPSKLDDKDKVKEFRGISYTGHWEDDRPEEATKESSDVPLHLAVDALVAPDAPIDPAKVQDSPKKTESKAAETKVADKTDK